MDVTTATGDDITVITEMWVALAREQREFGSHLLSGPNRQSARSLISQYVHSNECAIARDNGSTLGFVMYHTETGMYETDVTRGVIDNLYVVPEARNSGIGSALLDHAESVLLEGGVETLTIEALWKNENARNLYEQRGYEPHRIVYEQPTENDTHSKDGT